MLGLAYFTGFEGRNQVVDLAMLHAPSWCDAVPTALSAILVALLLSALGRGLLAATLSRKSLGAVTDNTDFSPYNLFAGWGIVSFALTLSGIIWPGSIGGCFLALAVISIAFLVVGLIRQKRLPWSYLFAVVLCFQVLFLLVINRTGIAGWDDMAHWSPNAIFLWRHNAFPSFELPYHYSAWPSYPYAAPFMTFMVSLLSGSFVVQGGAMMMWLSLASFAYALCQFPKPAEDKRSQLFRFFLAMLVVTILNPGYSPGFMITGQSDGFTSVIVGITGLLCFKLYENLREGRDESSALLQVLIASSVVVLVQLRQLNILIYLFMLFGFLCLAWRDRLVLSYMKRFLPTVVPALLIYLFWRAYVNDNMEKAGFRFLPLAEQHWSLIPELLKSAGQEMAKKSGFYGLMSVVSLWGLYGFFRRRDTLGQVSFVAALVFLGQIAFIFLAYMISSFTPDEVKTAASLYRYSTHVGLLGTVVVWCVLSRVLEQKYLRQRLMLLSVGSALILPVVAFIKPTWISPNYKYDLNDHRRVALPVAETAAPGTRFVLVDPLSDNTKQLVLNYAFALDNVRRESDLYFASAWTRYFVKNESQIAAALSQPETSIVILENPPQAVCQLMSVRPCPTDGVYMRQEKGGWLKTDVILPWPRGQ